MNNIEKIFSLIANNNDDGEGYYIKFNDDDVELISAIEAFKASVTKEGMSQDVPPPDAQKMLDELSLRLNTTHIFFVCHNPHILYVGYGPELRDDIRIMAKIVALDMYI